MTDENGAIYDIIFGTFLIVGLTEENFGSLSEKQIETYLKMYSEPEYIPVTLARCFNV